MGFSKWMARKGNVGGTARFVINTINSAIVNGILIPKNCKNNIGIEKELFKVIQHGLDARFPNDYLNIDREQITNEYLQNSGPGLAGFVEAILIVEAGWNNNDYDSQKMFREVIYEEFKKSGLVDSLIYGKLIK